MDHCDFASTLVDRIVPGFPREEINEIRCHLGYSDSLVVDSEAFHLWVIEGSPRIRHVFPADKYGLNVKLWMTSTCTGQGRCEYSTEHITCMVGLGLLSGYDTVRAVIEDSTVGSFIRKLILEEIGPMIKLPTNEVKLFSNEVIERFLNPFINHELIAISLNSISKFKVRVLPSILDHKEKHGILPFGLVFSLACLIKLYLRSDDFDIKDDEGVLEFFDEIKKESNKDISANVLSNQSFWESDLTKISGLKESVFEFLNQIDSKGIASIIKSLT